MSPWDTTVRMKNGGRCRGGFQTRPWPGRSGACNGHQPQGDTGGFETRPYLDNLPRLHYFQYRDSFWGWRST